MERSVSTEVKMKNPGWIGVGVIAGLLAVTSGFSYARYALTKAEVPVTVTREPMRECKGSGENIDCRYVVYTANEVFENRDSWWVLKFNSSDVQGKLRVNGNYCLMVTGFRVGWLSWYRNIVSVREGDC